MEQIKKKIKVIHLGVNLNKNYISIDNLLPKKPFLLFVGDRSRYKNFKNFVLAYSKSESLKKILMQFVLEVVIFQKQKFHF